MTVCPSCQFDNRDDRDFCRECGAYLRWDEPTEVDHAPVTTPEPAEPDPEAPTAVLPTAPAPPPPPEPVLPPEAVTVTLGQPGSEERAGGPVTVRVEPGTEASLTALVRNQSGIVDNFELRVAGWPQEWWTITPPVVHLVPAGAESESPEQEVLIRLHPPRTPEAEARPWAVKVTAGSGTSGGVVAAAPATVEIAPYEQFDARIRPERARGEGSAEFVIPVRNLGNSTLALSLTGEDAEGEVRFDFSPTLLQIPAGGEARATLRVSAPRPRAGAERRLSIVAEGDRETRTLTAMFAQEATDVEGRRRSWRWLLALAGALLIALGSFMSWTPDGLNGLCTQGASDCLRYDVFAERYLDVDGGSVDAGELTRLFSFVTSAGFVTLLLAAIVLLGIRTGGAAWFGGIATILVMILYLVISGDSGPGVWVIMLGGVLAIIAGLLATIAARR